MRGDDQNFLQFCASIVLNFFLNVDSSECQEEKKWTQNDVLRRKTYRKAEEAKNALGNAHVENRHFSNFNPFDSTARKQNGEDED